MLLLLVLPLLLVFGAVAQAAEKTRPRCENCGMFTDVSSTNVHAMLKVNGKEAEHNFVCLGCVNEFMRDKLDGKAELTGLKIIDYPTFGTKSPQWIDGMKAWYLFGTKPLKGSMEPYVAAFATKEAATKAKQKLGGDLLSFEDIWAKITGSDEGGMQMGQPGSAGEDEYVCSCTGGCCDGVHSDKPGTCPNCGMKLVKKSEKH